MSKKWSPVPVLSVCAVLCSAAEKPVYVFDFEEVKNLKSPANHAVHFQNHTGKRSTFSGQLVPQAGIGNSTALGCSRSAAWYSQLPLDWKEFAIELKFKLTKGLNANRHTVLFAYTADEKFTRRMVAWIKPRGQVEIQFQILNDKKVIEKSFELTSSPIQWQNNKFYSLRISSVSGGLAEIELDGKIIASAGNAMSFSDLRLPGEKFHSRLFFGYYPFYGLYSINNPLNGFIDDVKLYDKVDAKPSGIREAAAAETPSAPHLCLDNQWSTPFIVGDLPGKLLGTFVRADEKFWKNAARVRAKIEKPNLVVEFDCPVPAGMTPACAPGAIWRDSSDRIEFFIQPDPAVGKFYQYAAAVNGETYTGINSDANPNSKAKFTVRKTNSGYGVVITVPLDELGLAEAVSGTAFKGNFMRIGKTAGRYTFWSPAGENFHAFENFSTIICGSRKDYFLRKYGEMKKEFASLKLTPDFKKETDALEQSINAAGDDPGRFDAIESRLAALDYSLAQLRLDGAKQLIWRPEVWENNLNITRLSRPLRALKIRIPRNGRKVVGFAISNLENIPFLGQIKVFKHWPYKRPAWQHFGFQAEWDDFLGNITIHEGIGTKDESGRTIYDVLSPLPLNTLLRIPPKSTTPVWLEISGKGLKPGKYTGFIVLKNCGGKGGFESAELEVTVSETDLDEVQLDHLIYNSATRRAWHHESFRKFFLKYDYNFLELVPGNGLYIYWEKGPGDTLIPGKLEQLGKIVDLALASGFDAKRLKFMFDLGWNFGYGGKPETKLWERIMTASIPAWLDYLEKKYGIPHENVYFNPIDEPNGNIDDPQTSMAQSYRYSKFIKKIAPRAKVMNNPLYCNKIDTYKRYAEYSDAFDLHRPQVEGNKPFLKYMRSLALHGKEIWTYHILMKSQSPEAYRRDYWRNCRDGFNSITAFWSFDDHAGGDGFDSSDVTNPKGRPRRTDYGMAYVDFNYGTILVSRRFEAAQLGYQDTRLIAICRKHLDSLKRKNVDVGSFEKELETAILKGCDGAMADMDAQSDVILSLSEKLIKLDNSKK